MCSMAFYGRPDQTTLSSRPQVICVAFQNRGRAPTLRKAHWCRLLEQCLVEQRLVEQCLAQPEHGMNDRDPLYLIIRVLAVAVSTLLVSTTAHALGQQVGREAEITDLRLGQRVLVDDGTCPAGQIKEVSGAKMTSQGIARARKCIARTGPKK
jgi:hypothetical protein